MIKYIIILLIMAPVLHAQQYNTSWYSVNSGFMGSGNGKSLVKSVIGKDFMRVQSSSSAVTGGFLTNSSIRNSIILNVHDVDNDGRVNDLNNYPNPFSVSTNISFSIEGDADISIYIYNSLGGLVKELFDGYLSTGEYYFVWDGIDETGRQVTPGIYYYRIFSGSIGGEIMKTGKMARIN